MQRLLIVEDDADIAGALSLLFAHPQISLEVATNGIQAIARARELVPHVILLDVGLPAMDGLEVFATLRREPSLSATRVIFLSAAAPDGALLLAKECGAYACLKKPISGSVLVERVHAALGVAVPVHAGRWSTIGRKPREAPRPHRTPEQIARSHADTMGYEPSASEGGEHTIRAAAG